VGELLYGTSSWSEKSWVGSFYPEGTPPARFLSLYAKRFRAVEADVTYYRVPSRSMVEAWRTRTPDHFRVCAKFPRAIVHGGEGPRPDAGVVLMPEAVAATTDAFLDAMSALEEKCGPLVLQFPYFNKEAFASPQPFYDRLDTYLRTLPKDFRYAVEVRNKWWVTQPYLDILRDHEVAPVLVELGYLPHPADLAKKFDLVTTDFVYGRLIGDRKKVEERTKVFDRIVLDKGEEIERWAGLLEELLEVVPKAYVFANNHYAGHGPATIEALAERMNNDEA